MIDKKSMVGVSALVLLAGFFSVSSFAKSEEESKVTSQQTEKTIHENHGSQHGSKKEQGDAMQGAKPEKTSPPFQHQAQNQQIRQPDATDSNQYNEKVRYLDNKEKVKDGEEHNGKTENHRGNLPHGSVYGLTHIAQKMGVLLEGLTEEEAKALLKEEIKKKKTELLAAKADKLGISIEGLDEAAAKAAIKSAYEEKKMKKLQEIAQKLGIDIEGLTEKEVNEAIKNELRESHSNKEKGGE